MVIPFLSLYLTESLGLSLKETGMVLSMFGLGAMAGSYLGGWLTDRFGHFWVQLFSLTVGGMLFFMLIGLRQFEYVAIGIFILSMVTECLRPANNSSVVHYAKPENVTRAFSLNRMAVNLGFSIGPALGGLLAGISYHWLFVADGATCMAAGVVFYFYFRNMKGSQPNKQHLQAKQLAVRSPYKDVPFICFVILCACFAIIFFQFFTTLPLYYRQVYLLSEASIGGILAFNGIVVFLLEMVMVFLLGERLSKATLIKFGLITMGMSFVLLNLYHHISILYLSMLLLCFAEILAQPFMATVTVQRSNEHNRGAYMGLYTLSYAVAHVLAPILGTYIIANYNFETLWWVIGIASLVTGVGFYAVVQAMDREREQGVPQPVQQGKQHKQKLPKQRLPEQRPSQRQPQRQDGSHANESSVVNTL